VVLLHKTVCELWAGCKILTDDKVHGPISITMPNFMLIDPINAEIWQQMLKHGNFSILFQNGHLPFWICCANASTTHEEYLGKLDHENAYSFPRTFLEYDPPSIWGAISTRPPKGTSLFGTCHKIYILPKSVHRCYSWISKYSETKHDSTDKTDW